MTITTITTDDESVYTWDDATNTIARDAGDDAPGYPFLDDRTSVPLAYFVEAAAEDSAFTFAFFDVDTGTTREFTTSVVTDITDDS